MRKNKINIDIVKEKVEFWSMLKGVFSFKTLEFLGSIALTFFIAIIGTWALPQMNENIQEWFSLCILFSCYYVILSGLKVFGLFNDESEAHV
jgi:hypothetical protein